LSGNFKKEDLRIIKTYNSLIQAMHMLLSHRNFGQITVNDLCEEAQISRATFYTHFNDKYDLLKYWLKNLKPEIINKNYTYNGMEESVNNFIRGNTKIIKNVIENANNEVLEILQAFIISLINISSEINADDEMNIEQIVLSNFCTGGIVNLLMWQVKNKFPQDLQMMNTYFYKMLRLLLNWE